MVKAFFFFFQFCTLVISTRGKFQRKRRIGNILMLLFLELYLLSPHPHWPNKTRGAHTDITQAEQMLNIPLCSSYTEAKCILTLFSEDK